MSDRASLVAPPSGLARLWKRLAAPIDPIAAADVLVGLRQANARQLLAVSLAASPEADNLCEALPHVLRSLSVSTTQTPVRCDGEIRGPVMWSATMAARSASPGAGGVFICASAVRAFDTDENRVLVAALGRIVRAARAAESPVVGSHKPPSYDLRRAKHNGDRARRALEHRSLKTVSRAPIDGRTVFRARTGAKAAVFRTAIELLQRSWAEVGAEDLAPYVDERTYVEHNLAADVLDLLEMHGAVADRLKIDDGMLVGGSFAYGHPGRDGGDRRAGVLVDGREITSLTQL
jgi:hypothetical protein